MDIFSLRRLSFGPLVIATDGGLPALAEERHRLDADGDMPRLIEATGLKDGDIAVDCGAFVGDTAAALAKSGARIIAFEPFLDAFTCLIYNTYRMKVAAFNTPTGNGEKVELVYACHGRNHGMRRVQPSDGLQAVPTTRIDYLGLQAVKLIKVDVEGSEIPTLLGAAETIKRCRPFLYCEMYKDGLANRGYTPEQLEQTIRELGYSLTMWGELPRFDWFCTPV